VFSCCSAHARSVSLDVDCEPIPTLRVVLANAGKFDVNESNDVLPRTLVATAAPPRWTWRLRLQARRSRAGVLISHLPEKYSGRLSLATASPPSMDTHRGRSRVPDHDGQATEERMPSS